MFSLSKHMEVNDSFKEGLNKALDQANNLKSTVVMDFDSLIEDIEEYLEYTIDYDEALIDHVVNECRNIGKNPNISGLLNSIGQSIEGLKSNYWKLLRLFPSEIVEESIDPKPYSSNKFTVDKADNGGLILKIDDLPPRRNSVGDSCFERWRTMVHSAINEHYNYEVPRKNFVYVWYELGLPVFTTDIDNYTIRAINNGIKNSGLIQNDTIEHFMFGLSSKVSPKEYTKIWINPCSKDSLKIPF